MGFSFGGGGKSKSKQTEQALLAQEALINAIFPGITEPTGGDITGTFFEYVAPLGGFQSSLAGLHGVTVPPYIAGTEQPQGQVQPVQTGGMPFGQGLAQLLPKGTQTQTGTPPQTGTGQQGFLLPPLGLLADYQTLFEKLNTGQLTPEEQTILNSLIGSVTQPIQLGGMTGAGAGGVSAGSVKFGGVEDIGTITTRIMDNLPQPMQEFINNIFQDSSPEAIQQELENFSQAMLEEAQRNAQSTANQLLSRFASMGLGTSGTALEMMKQVAVETAINVNSLIAQSRLNMLDTLIRARDIGVRLVQVLGSLGAEEQKNLVAGKIAELNAQADIIQSQIMANAQIQSSLINAQADIIRSQLSLLGDVTGLIATERAREEEAKQKAVLTPYDILLQLATGTPPEHTQTAGSSFGLNLLPPITIKSGE